MKKVFQTREGFPDGNCTEACVASVLELPLNAVPTIKARDDTWIDELNQFLLTHGLYAICLKVDGVFCPSGWHFIGGKSPRGDFGHYVVGYNGKMIHDPHPSGKGLRSEEDYLVFIAVNPAKSMMKERGMPGMKQGYKFNSVECPNCHRLVKENWLIPHLKSGCEVGNPH